MKKVFQKYQFLHVMCLKAYAELNGLKIGMIIDAA